MVEAVNDENQAGVSKVATTVAAVAVLAVREPPTMQATRAVSLFERFMVVSVAKL
jgi:hypothetical protein